MCWAPATACTTCLHACPGLCLQVVPLPDELLLGHATLYDEFKNSSHWPKHVLLHYAWHDEGDVDITSGLLVLLTAGAPHACVHVNACVCAAAFACHDVHAQPAACACGRARQGRLQCMVLQADMQLTHRVCLCL